MSVAIRSLDLDDPERLEAATRLLAAACRFDRADAVAREVLFGPGPQEAQATALAAWRGEAGDERIAGVVAASARWIRVLAVAPAERGAGVGSALLAAAEGVIARTHAQTHAKDYAGADGQAATSAPTVTRAVGPAIGPAIVRVLDQPGNYLAPGVDVRDSDTIAWLERRGYQRGGERVNLLVDVRDDPRARPDHAAALAARCERAGYRVRRATAADAPALLAHVRDSYSEAWAFEVARALGLDDGGGSCVHVAVRDRDGAGGPAASGAFAGFAAHDGNNRGLGWFGPAGTAPEHRRRGLGEALLAACLVDVAAAGHARCEVAWIGPRGFYERASGVVGERRFVAMQTELSTT